MTARHKAAVWGGGLLSAVVIALAALFIIRQTRPAPPYHLTGVMLVDDKDPQKQTPIGFAAVTATLNRTSVTARGDASGLFALSLPRSSRPAAPIRLRVHSAGFVPREFLVSNPGELQILHLESVTRTEPAPVAHPTLISHNVRVRYAERTSVSTNVGSVVKTFQVPNAGNVPCANRSPCSPDGKWKATVGSATIEGQQGNEFHNVRLTCIAGPCPFSRRESEAAVDHGHNLKVSVLNWSDTVTWLLEAEVVQTQPIEVIREAYAAVFGSSMNFTLPASAEGPSIEAEVGGHDIIYPLGPDLKLSWAVCSVKVAADGTKQFHCDLKPEYRFK